VIVGRGRGGGEEVLTGAGTCAVIGHAPTELTFDPASEADGDTPGRCHYRRPSQAVPRRTSGMSYGSTSSSEGEGAMARVAIPKLTGSEVNYPAVSRSRSWAGFNMVPLCLLSA
jgi:hypothetical protein